MTYVSCNSSIAHHFIALINSCMDRVVMVFLHYAVNVSQLRCPDMPDASMQVCGENGRTYPSLCHLVQQSRTQVQYRGPCNQANCPVSPVSA